MPSHSDSGFNKAGSFLSLLSSPATYRKEPERLNRFSRWKPHSMWRRDDGSGKTDNLELYDTKLRKAASIRDGNPSRTNRTPGTKLEEHHALSFSWKEYSIETTRYILKYHVIFPSVHFPRLLFFLFFFGAAARGRVLWIPVKVCRYSTTAKNKKSSW